MDASSAKILKNMPNKIFMLNFVYKKIMRIFEIFKIFKNFFEFDLESIETGGSNSTLGHLALV